MQSEVNVDLDMNLNIGLAPTIETFEVVAKSDAQKPDAGWWYQVSFGGFDLGEPEGPFPTKEIATVNARSGFLD